MDLVASKSQGKTDFHNELRVKFVSAARNLCNNDHSRKTIVELLVSDGNLGSWFPGTGLEL